MICPFCANSKTRVNTTVVGFKNKRYRTCPACKKSFTTEEVPTVDLYMFEYLEYLEDIGEITKKDLDRAVKRGEENA